MPIIAGLGNPGQQHETTRHNVGFMALDALAEEFGLKWANSKKFKAAVAKNADFILLKPQTFMNDSGQAIAAALAYYKLQPENLTVIHDDLDIPLGKYKFSVASRSAGHKGVQSIIDRLNTKNFKRLRIGIKTPTLEKIPADKFVLQKFGVSELKAIKKLITQIKRELA
ncbi:aminoacyl-tRNA hydrolase [Candidatus Falkowbacteria bacterium]|nr:aminoacyl-tRNA hydrolase [Candidatus Falkowbacteria bacterium]OIP81742.1 MAG: aminoacyl-tRNA hydrolase [Parcubacteria group bacterium CG2_30_45_37]